jgi:hypothetical protein
MEEKTSKYGGKLLMKVANSRHPVVLRSVDPAGASRPPRNENIGVEKKFHSSDTLLTGKEPWVPTERRLVLPSAGMDTRKILTLPVIEPGRIGRNNVSCMIYFTMFTFNN